MLYSIELNICGSSMWILQFQDCKMEIQSNIAVTSLIWYSLSKTPFAFLNFIIKYPWNHNLSGKYYNFLAFDQIFNWNSSQVSIKMQGGLPCTQAK
jgi:hypothetical protein